MRNKFFVLTSAIVIFVFSIFSPKNAFADTHVYDQSDGGSWGLGTKLFIASSSGYVSDIIFYKNPTDIASVVGKWTNVAVSCFDPTYNSCAGGSGGLETYNNPIYSDSFQIPADGVIHAHFSVGGNVVAGGMYGWPLTNVYNDEAMTNHYDDSNAWVLANIEWSGSTYSFPLYGNNKLFRISVGVFDHSPYYSQISNLSTASTTIRSGPSMASSTIKTLPEDWIVYVASTTDVMGSAIINDTYRWYKVVDPTDNVSGWMVASGTAFYLPYNILKQSEFASTSDYEIDASSRPPLILDAVDHYYNNASTTGSLYSSDDDIGHPISDLKDGDYKQKLIWGILAQETGGINFNNESVTYDYGHGISQITPYHVFANEDPYGDWIYNADDNRGIASKISIPLCQIIASNLYEKCYTHGGEYNSTSTKSYKHYNGDSGEPIYQYYANTTQSIYANIKDGMRMLLQKYYVNDDINTSTSTSYGTFTASERRNILTTELYNGDDCGYVDDVANRLDEIGSFFPSATSSDISSLIERMHTAGQHTQCVNLQSPGDVSIQDSKGRIVGVIDNKEVNSFPLAVYDKTEKFVKILAAEGEDYTYTVQGTGNGVYGINITIKNGDQKVQSMGKNIPISPKEIHTYSIDKDAIKKGEDPVIVKIDKNGDGVIDRMIRSGLIVTPGEFSVKNSN